MKASTKTCPLFITNDFFLSHHTMLLCVWDAQVRLYRLNHRHKQDWKQMGKHRKAQLDSSICVEWVCDAQLQATCNLYCSIFGESMHIQPFAPRMPTSIYHCFPITLKSLFHVWQFILFLGAVLPPPLLYNTLHFSCFYLCPFLQSYLSGKKNQCTSFPSREK